MKHFEKSQATEKSFEPSSEGTFAKMGAKFVLTATKGNLFPHGKFGFLPRRKNAVGQGFPIR